MVQYKVILTELCKLVMRPPNQLSAVTNESRLFRPQWIVNAQLGPRSFDNYFEIEVKTTYKPTQ